MHANLIMLHVCMCITVHVSNYNIHVHVLYTGTYTCAGIYNTYILYSVHFVGMCYIYVQPTCTCLCAY